MKNKEKHNRSLLNKRLFSIQLDSSKALSIEGLNVGHNEGQMEHQVHKSNKY